MPFNYQGHGLSWDPLKWPLNFTGKEQSPIALTRDHAANPNFKFIDFSDK